MNLRARPARGLGGGVGRQGGGIAVAGQGGAQEGDLAELLLGKAQPGAKLRIQAGLAGRRDRGVEQRARGGHQQPARPQGLAGPAEHLQRAGGVVLPDVAPVHDADGEAFLHGKAGEDRVELPHPPHGVDVQGRDRQREEGVEVAAEFAEIGRDEELQPGGRGGEQGIGPPQGGALGIRQVQDQGRLVELDPLRALAGEPLQDLPINWQQAVEEAEPIERRLPRLRLAEQQVGDRADQHRLGPDPQRQRLVEFVKDLGRGQPERRVRAEFRDDVVIVRVEPLRHVAGKGAGRAPGAIAVARVVTGAHPRAIAKRVSRSTSPSCAPNRAGTLPTRQDRSRTWS